MRDIDRNSSLQSLPMKIFGVLLLFSGWGLALAALALLRTMGSRAGFVAAAVLVELLGVALLFRAYLSDLPGSEPYPADPYQQRRRGRR